MRISSLKTAVAGLALVAATAVPSFAQSTLVGANLSILRGDEVNGVGVSLDAAKTITPMIAVVGDFGLNKFDDYTVTSYLGGLRFLPTLTSTAFQPYGQFLVGIEHCCEQNAFTFQIGAGVDIPMTEKLNFRVQYDFRRASYDGTGFNANRFGFGVSLPLGGN